MTIQRYTYLVLWTILAVHLNSGVMAGSDTCYKCAEASVLELAMEDDIAELTPEMELELKNNLTDAILNGTNMVACSSSEPETCDFGGVCFWYEIEMSWDNLDGISSLVIDMVVSDCYYDMINVTSDDAFPSGNTDKENADFYCAFQDSFCDELEEEIEDENTSISCKHECCIGCYPDLTYTTIQSTVVWSNEIRSRSRSRRDISDLDMYEIMDIEETMDNLVGGLDGYVNSELISYDISDDTTEITQVFNLYFRSSAGVSASDVDSAIEENAEGMDTFIGVTSVRTSSGVRIFAHSLLLLSALAYMVYDSVIQY